MRTYKVLIACGSGIATSTVIANRVKDLLTENGYRVKVEQTKVVEVEKRAPEFDLIVASTQIPKTIMTPYVFAINYLTGINKESTDKEILEKIAEIAAD